MNDEQQTLVREIVEYLVNDWLMREGVALTRTYGEASRASVGQFKKALTQRITTALTAAEQRGAEQQRERDAQLAEAMGMGEVANTGRYKAINIAAAIRSNQ